MRTFITGANGFLGSHLVEALLERGDQVVCLVREKSDLTWLQDLPVKYVYGDIGSEDEGWIEGLREAEVVFHLAGKIMALSRAEYFRVNGRGPERLAESIIKINPRIRRLVMVSSLAAQGPGRGKDPVSELNQGKPINIYGESKREGEERVRKYTDRIPLTIVRPAAIYGPRDRGFLDVFQAAHWGIRLGIWRKPKIINMGYARDIASGIILAGEKDCPSGEAFLLGDRRNYDWDQVTREICRASGRKGIKIAIPFSALCLFAALSGLAAQIRRRPSMFSLQKIPDLIQENWALDISKAEKVLGYHPRWDFSRGSKETYDWYRQSGWL